MDRDNKGRFIKGSQGIKFTDEHKRKLSLSKMGDKNPNFGKHPSEETIRKLSLSKMGNKNYNFNKHLYGEDSTNWSGGRTYSSDGYVLIYKPKHPKAVNGKYVFEHRHIMEGLLNRYLNSKEVVHHINEIKDDNRIENLMLFANSNEHHEYHRKLRREENLICVQQ